MREPESEPELTEEELEILVKYCMREVALQAFDRAMRICSHFNPELKDDNDDTPLAF